MSTLDVFKLLLDKELNMPSNRVWAYNAEMDLPKDNDLFIVLFLKEQKPISNTVKYISTDTGMEEHQSMNIREEITISLVSKNTQARERAYEAILALNSFYSRQLQAQNKMHFSILGDFYDASFLEGSSMLNRWDLRIRVFKSYAKINNIDYFDKFSLDITEQMQGKNNIKSKFLYGDISGVFGFDTKKRPKGVIGLSTRDNLREGIILNRNNIVEIYQ